MVKPRSRSGEDFEWWQRTGDAKEPDGQDVILLVRPKYSSRADGQLDNWRDSIKICTPMELAGNSLFMALSNAGELPILGVSSTKPICHPLLADENGLGKITDCWPYFPLIPITNHLTLLHAPHPLCRVKGSVKHFPKLKAQSFARKSLNRMMSPAYGWLVNSIKKAPAPA